MAKQRSSRRVLVFLSLAATVLKVLHLGPSSGFKTVPDIEAATASGEPLFIALKDDQLRAIPEALQSQLSDPQRVGQYTLFRMNQAK